jgi:hypothetical protein
MDNALGYSTGGLDRASQREHQGHSAVAKRPRRFWGAVLAGASYYSGEFTPCAQAMLAARTVATFQDGSGANDDADSDFDSG